MRSRLLFALILGRIVANFFERNAAFVLRTRRLSFIPFLAVSASLDYGKTVKDKAKNRHNTKIDRLRLVGVSKRRF